MRIKSSLLFRVCKTDSFETVFYIQFLLFRGAYTEGDGTDSFQAPDFVMEHNVVLVVINYRLGPFGYANFNLRGYTGNMALKDQRKALKWTKRNIKYFGGDPDAITLIGQSAGNGFFFKFMQKYNFYHTNLKMLVFEF